MTCDEYQIAFDQLAAGAPASVSQADVDAHIASCASCSAYVSMSRKVTDSMMNTLSASPPALDLHAMHALIAKFHRQLKRGRVVVPLIFAVSMLAMQRLVESVSWGSAIVSAMLGGLLFYLMWGVLTRRKLRELTALDATSGDELIQGMRSVLDQHIRNERQSWWVLPLLGVVFHWQFAGWAPPSVAVLVVELALLGSLAISIVRYGRAKRERALLG